MRDPFTWSLSLGRIFGVAVRIHVLFGVFAASVLLNLLLWPPLDPLTKQPYPYSYALDGLVLLLMLFAAVLLHEMGHCFAAHLVQGDAGEVMLWPLGGLAPLEVPHTWRAQLVAALGGPVVSLLLCTAAGLGLGLLSFWPPAPWSSPLAFRALHFGDNAWYGHNQEWGDFTVATDNGKIVAPPGNGPPAIVSAAKVEQDKTSPTGFRLKDEKVATLEGPRTLSFWPLLLVQFFWINSIVLLVNLLPGLPLDGGRILQALLWSRGDYRQATLGAIFAGFVVMLLIALVGMALNSIYVLLLAGLVYTFCRHQWYVLETGGDEPLFGYDFSQGYTSLEREQPAVARKQPNFFQRWRQRRAARKLQREQELRETEERRMDELLEKVQRDGLQSLTDEEKRFLTRVSARYRRN